MVSSWSTHEKLECIYYMENNKAFMLTNGGKVSFLLPPTILAKGSQVHKELFFLVLKGMLHCHYCWVKNCMTWC
jgi:hypothetical protein